MAAIGVAVALGVSACGSGGGDEGVQAVASVFPLVWIADQVAPDADVTSLVQSRAVEAHGLELSPAQRAAVESADVVVYMGGIGFQPQVEEAAAAEGRAVAVADIAGDDVRRRAGGIDPHMWFDPGLMAALAEEVGAAFAVADPAGAAGYEQRAAEVAEDLIALDEELGGLLSGCAAGTAIVSHEAYGYLLGPHGLEQRGISGGNPEAGASPAQLAELTGVIRNAGIVAVLAEPAEGRSDAEALATEAGVELLEINSLEVADDQQYRAGYPALLRQQAATFAQALQCAGALGR